MTDSFDAWWEGFKNFDDSLGHKEAFARRVWNEAMQANADEIERLRKQVAQISEEYEKLAGERGPH